MGIRLQAWVLDRQEIIRPHSGFTWHRVSLSLSDKLKTHRLITLTRFEPRSLCTLTQIIVLSQAVLKTTINLKIQKLQDSHFHVNFIDLPEIIQRNI